MNSPYKKKFLRLSHNFQYRDLNIILLRLWKYINYARSHGGTLETVDANPPNLELVHTLSHKASHLKINWRVKICKFFLHISMTYAWKVKSILQHSVKWKKDLSVFSLAYVYVSTGMIDLQPGKFIFASLIRSERDLFKHNVVHF